MLGKVFWGLVILLFVGILIIPFILPSYYASQAKAQYSENFVGDDDLDHRFQKILQEDLLNKHFRKKRPVVRRFP